MANGDTPWWAQEQPAPSSGGSEAVPYWAQEPPAPGALESAVKPITDIPSTFMQMEREGAEQVQRGYGQIGSLQPWEMAKGVGNVALGTFGELSAPINAPLKTIVGDPTRRGVTDITGSPAAGEIAGGLAEAGAGFALPTRLPRLRSAPKLPAADPYGVTLSEGERTGDIGMRSREADAMRAGDDPYAAAFKAQREAQIAGARENLVTGLDPAGENLAAAPGQAGQAISSAVTAEKGGTKNIVDSLYEEARMRPGEIHAGVFEGMPQQIRGDLTLGDKPIIVDNLTPHASRMLNYLDNEIGNLRITNRAAPIGFGYGRPMEGGALDQQIVGVNLNGIDRWRKNLSSMRRAAFSSSMPGTVSEDARATQQILDNFDRRVTEAINNPATFTGDQDAVGAWNKARAAYSDYRSTFTPQGRGDAVGKAIHQIAGDPINDPITPDRVVDLLESKNGLAIANRLRNILGENSGEWIGAKQELLQRLIRPSEGEADFGTGKQAQRLSTFLNGDTAGIYSPSEQRVLRGYANLMRDITLPPGAYSPSAPAINRMNQNLAQRIGGVVGAMIGKVGGPITEAAGYVAGRQIERAAEARLNNMSSNFPIVSQQMKKWSDAQQRALTQPNPLTRRAAVGATVNLDKALAPFGFDTKSLSGPVPAAAEPDQQNVPGPVQQRQTGGRVNKSKNFHRPIKNLPKGGDGLFIEPDKLTPEVQMMLDHNRDRFAKHFNYADEFGAGDPNTFDSRGDYNCGRCNQEQNGDCLLIKKNNLNLKAGSCRQWESVRSGDPEMLLQREGVGSASYGVAKNGEGFGCHRCPYSKPAKHRDDQGRARWCGLGGFHQTPHGCCELNGAETV